MASAAILSAEGPQQDARYEALMPAEITAQDEFGQAILRTIRAWDFTSVLEIGSFDGEGSTQVFVEALRNVRNPRMVCIEADPIRFARLVNSVADYPWVQCKCTSSISLASLTPKDFDHDVWKSPYNYLRYPKDIVESWWETSRRYLASVHVGFLEQAEQTFDVALIDGDEFTGYDEYRLVRNRVKCLMLDDAFHAYKCHRVHEELRADPRWRCIWSSVFVRNGAAIWVRK